MSLSARLALVCIASIGCREAAKDEPSGAPQVSAASAPSLLLTPQAHDFGAVIQGTPLTRVFEVRNTSASQLRLLQAGPVLGCTGVPEPKLLEAGATGKLRVTCTTEFQGPLRVSLPIVSSEGQKAEELRIHAEVTPLLSFDIPFLDVKLTYGEERTVEARLVGALAPKAKLTLKEAGACGFEILPPTESAGSKAPIRIVVKQARVGTHAGNLVFFTGLERPKEISLPYSCKVQGTLSVSPTNPYFNLRLSGPKTQLLEVKSSQPGFALEAVEILEGPFSASFEATGSRGVYRVTLNVKEEQLSAARGVVGNLRIRSNDRSEPVRDVPLLALGRIISE